MSQFIEMFGGGNWPQKTLGEVGSFTRGGGFLKSDFVEHGIPCIHYGQIHTKFGPFITSHITEISSDLESKTKFASKGDLVIAITSEDTEGSCKSTAWLGDYPVAVGGHAAIYKHSMSPLYMSFFFKSTLFNYAKIEYVHGTKVFEIKPDDIAKILVPCPPMSLQNQFSAIAEQSDKSKFGDFKSQFIEMFSKYPSETPWHKLLTIINGKAYPEEYNNIGTYPICGSAGIMYYGERKLCDANTIILGRKGNINHPIYMESDYWIVDTAFCLDVNKSILLPKYFYYWCCQYDFTKLNKQGVLPSLTRKDLEKIEMSVPPMAEQKKFVSIVEQADKSKFELKQCIENIDKVIKSLING